MSYLRRFEYKILPEESYPIIRNCAICGGKSVFVNSNNFRVNANGNRIDVWLIYHCNKCKHTYNVTIYERLKPDKLTTSQYKSFMENDKELAMKYGTDKSIFERNKAEIDWNGINYQIINVETLRLVTDEQMIFKSGDLIQVTNPCGLKSRIDKIIADILHIKRNKVKQLIDNGSIEILKNHPTPNIDIFLRGDSFSNI